MSLNAVILLAAGRGSRMEGHLKDKILAQLHGQSVFSFSLNAFLESGLISHLIIVFRDEEQRSTLDQILAENNPKDVSIIWVQGGEERQNSVSNALESAPEEIDYVFIHDCARPLITQETIKRLHQNVIGNQSVCLAHRVTDTIKQDLAPESSITQKKLQTLDRNRLWAMETPQVFRREAILDAYRHVAQNNIPITDDASALEQIGQKITLFENPLPNPKLTSAKDIPLIEFLLTKTLTQKEE
jgi:2-C-methyl-D-erythritol 4-phosphate cytidylyltransferase